MDISCYSPKVCKKIAKKASLRYVQDISPGISRRRYGKGFAYSFPNGSRVVDSKTINRIQKLGIPPAYKQVWICPHANGHIQATGLDDKKRKQYIYHSLWTEARQQRKFNSMLLFGKTLSTIRQHINHELNKPLRLTKSQIISAVIYLLDTSCIRIGSSLYAKQNQSYGLTTLRKKHLFINKNKAFLEFKGKNSQAWNVILEDKKIVKILKKCEEIPGYELFKYKDDNNNLRVITSQDVNGYLQALTNQPFTAKDFRTWIACRETFNLLMMNENTNEEPLPRYIKTCIKKVALLLGHTPTVCKTNYINPEIINWFEGKRLEKWRNDNVKKIESMDKDEMFLHWLEKNAS